MTKIEQLAQAATRLTDDQLDGLIEYARSLAGVPFIDHAPPEVLASIERGLAQHAAGECVPADEAFARLHKKIEEAG